MGSVDLSCSSDTRGPPALHPPGGRNGGHSTTLFPDMSSGMILCTEPGATAHGGSDGEGVHTG